MTTSPFVAPHHPAAGNLQPHDAAIPARRPHRPFVPAPVHTGVVRPPEVESDQLVVADAVLELLRTVNQNAVRRA
ncbi:hypothetical protein [Nakamurella deserti]|uniref:hypothetical protein n=1 Tax=Nakamurella deserti TaxID=2164074 RepID=UPI00130054E4|nr:hypothetical protein [Nakamurella deserti]